MSVRVGDCRVPVGLAGALAELGVPAADVLAVAGLPSRLLELPAPRVPVEGYFALWAAIGEVSGDVNVGVRLAAGIDAEVTEPLFLAVLSAANLAAAVEVTARYKGMISPDDLVVARRGGELSVAYRWPPPFDDPPRPLVDAELAFLVEIARRATRCAELSPCRVELRRARLEPGSQHGGFFGCSIRLEADRDAVVFHLTDAHRPFRTYNPQLLAALDPHLDTGARAPAGIADQVRAVLAQRLRGRRPTLGEVSAELAMSSRSLQRALRDEGRSFRALLDEERNRHAGHYLRSAGFSDAEIAYLVGFDDVTSFYRAFRAWHGMTPGQFRRGNRDHR